ncbi:hypothetical protein [Streptomyces sp. 6N223]|uniref:hypothetical protein n=1 Tax=Streptomyces sp. 6N223 TaxID=3457412 RepID=UPI003FD591CE
MTQLYRSLATVVVAATGSLLASLASAGEASAEVIPENLGAHTDELASGLLDSTAATLTGATGYAVGPALDLQLNPLANSTTDLLSNSAGTQIADFRPIGTDVLTGPLADGASARELPGAVLGRLLG